MLENLDSKTDISVSPGSLSRDELAVRQLPLRAIAALDVVARCEGQLYLAAQLQGISPAALSTQITRLETFLGSDVLKRRSSDRRKIELTEKGAILVQALRTALPALLDLAASIDEVTKSPDDKRKGRQRSEKSNGLPRRSREAIAGSERESASA